MTKKLLFKDICFCGLYIENGLCPRHKGEWYTHEKYQKERRVRVGRWSGPTKRFKGAYENE